MPIAMESSGKSNINAGAQQVSEKGDTENGPPKRRRKKQISANVSGTRYEVVRQTALKVGFSIAREDDFRTCYLIWSDMVVSTDRITEMLPFQRVNHFPGMGEICRKDCLSRNMSKMRKVRPNDFDIFPRTWNFPQEFSQFHSYVKDLKSKNKRKTFIIKPANGAMGNGIRLVRHPEALTPSDHTVVQEYISDPLLVDGYKCDMRIYVLVTKCMPLRIFIFNDGLLRMSTEEYEAPTDGNYNSLFMHLTNYSVNKHNEKYEKGANDSSGSKRSLRFLMSYLRRDGHDIQELWRRITDVIIKTLLVAAPHVCHAYRMCRPGQPPGARSVCFEVLGFDIILDKNLKPWLLEVNRSPSFGTDERIDQEIKSSLLEDAFRLLNVKASDKRRHMNAQKRESQRRLFGGAGGRPNVEFNGDVQLMRQQKLNSRNKEMLRNMLLRIRKDAAEEEYESANCGRFRRCFPPDDCFTFEYYVQLLKVSVDQYSPGSRNSLHRDFELTYAKNLKEEEVLDMLAKCEEDDEMFDKKNSNRTPRPLQSMPPASPANRRSRSSSSFYASTSSEEYEDDEEEDEDLEKEAENKSSTSKFQSTSLMTRAPRVSSPPIRRRFEEKFGASKPPISVRTSNQSFRSRNNSLPARIPSTRPLSTTRQRLSAVLASSSGDDDRNADEISARAVLRALREHRIRFPGKSPEEAERILQKLYENWNFHKPRVANYWIMKLDSPKRKKVIDIVLSNVHVLVQRHYKVQDVEGIRLYRLIKRVCNRLQWSTGQGLWQAFEAPGSWETILSKNSEQIPLSEMSCCRRVVELCKDCLLIVYKYALDQQKTDSDIVSSFDPPERQSSSVSFKNSTLPRSLGTGNRSIVNYHRDPHARISVS